MELVGANVRWILVVNSEVKSCAAFSPYGVVWIRMICVFFQCVQKVGHTLERHRVAAKLQSLQFYGFTVICKKEI